MAFAGFLVQVRLRKELTRSEEDIIRGVVVAAVVAAGVLAMTGPALAHTKAKQAHRRKRHHALTPPKKGVKAHTNYRRGLHASNDLMAVGRFPAGWRWSARRRLFGTLMAPQRILTAAHCVGETLSANGLVMNTGASAWTVIAKDATRRRCPVRSDM